MQWLKNIIITVLVAMIITSCNDAPKHTDTLSAGTIDISVDETYRPVIEEQLKVFDSSYPDAKINVHYKPEAECFKDYFDNKARLILVTRQLSKEEKALCDQKQIAPSSLELARDAIAVVVNNSSPDSVLDRDAVKGILTGVYNKKYTVVFDNQGSSTVRFIMDSLLKGQKLGGNVFAAKGNNEVVDYVSKNPDAIGFVGVSYVFDTTDKLGQGDFTKRVRVVAVKSDTDNQFHKPYQANIAQKLYPFTRSFFYVSRESYPGLGTGFANFLCNDRGQLIFSHAYLFPLRMSVIFREAEVNK